MGRRSDDPRCNVLSVRLSDEKAKEIASLVAPGRTASDVLREALDQFLDARRDGKAVR